MVTIIKRGDSPEDIKKKVNAAISNKRKSDITKYAGSIKLSVDPLKWQKEIRNEWE